MILLKRLGKKEIETMDKIIVDANLIIGGFARDETNNEAIKIISKIKLGEIEAVAPNFLLIEVLNILIKKKKLDLNVIKKIIKEILDLGITFKAFITSNILELNEICYKYKVTSYDGLYLLLAKKEKTKLVTNDQELLKIKNLTIDLKDF